MLQREAAPLRTQLVNQLREDIIAGRYKAGDRLTEKVLEAAFGVSRTVVREALRQLESESLVETVPNVGPRVRALTYNDVANLYQVRLALEAAACRLAATLATDEQIQDLVEAFRLLVTKAPEKAPESLVQDKNEFYQALIAASGNPIIGEMLANVQARIAQLRFITLGQPGRSAAMLEELRAVVSAIESRDPLAAVAAATLHVEAAGAIALNHVAHLRNPQEAIA
ncbi:GntR family transcriptional regulator [Citricoccus sp. NPDC055426]|uniref:GntR family transcriptional regulator n=1 Tax=Citricoccus sp. NPDC055426 TaxID=3155536 RepID=UPI00341E6289